MGRAIVYGRVSMVKQKASGAGEMAQEDDCTDFVNRLECELVGPFLEDEAVSGSKPIDKRPALLEALGELRKGDFFVVAKRDRLGRDPMVIAAIECEVKRRKGRILSAAGEGTADDSPESIFMRRIMDAAAEFELLRLKVRCKSSAAAKRRRGLRTGHPPYGWDVDVDGPRNELTGKPIRHRPNPVEQAVLEQMERWRADGWTLRAIAAELNARGIPTKRGTGKEGGRRWKGEWRSSSVDSVLKLAPHWRAHAAQAQGEVEPAGVL